MKVNAKTIRRDLELFRRVGFPIVERVGPYGRKNWRADASALAAHFGTCGQRSSTVD